MPVRHILPRIANDAGTCVAGNEMRVVCFLYVAQREVTYDIAEGIVCTFLSMQQVDGMVHKVRAYLFTRRLIQLGRIWVMMHKRVIVMVEVRSSQVVVMIEVMIHVTSCVETNANRLARS